MKKIFTLAFLSVCFNFYGQVGFERNLVIDQYFGDTGQNSVVAADFDNDGKIDIAQAGSTRLMWFKNLDGQGKFSTGKNIVAYPLMRKVVAADMDGDGFKDLVYSRYTNSNNYSEICWVKNNGDGTFGFGVQVVGAISGFDPKFQVVDVDADGALDIAYIKTHLRWHKNNGQGTFTLASNILNNNTYGFVFEDVTGDGKADMITRTISDLTAYKSNGDGTFTLLETIQSNLLSNDMIAAGDMDGDGDKDIMLLFASSDARNIKWYKNNAGVFADAAVLITLPAVTVSANADVILPADVDGDGVVDLIVSSADINKVAWYKNMGNAVLGTEQVITVNAQNVADIATGDIDSDGRMDVLSASTNDNKVAWYKNTATGFAPEVVIGRVAYQSNFAEAGDLDGDGDKDLVSASSNLGQIAWYKNANGQGDFSVTQQIVITSTLRGAYNVKLDDIDNDGDLDIIAAGVNPLGTFGSSVWYKNDGTGNFTEYVIVPAAENNGSFYYADVDADSDIDVVQLAADVLYTRKNNGNGTFAAPQSQTPWTATVHPNKILFADLDGDGENDLIIGTTMNDLIWYPNIGQGIFTNPLQISPFAGNYQLHIADLDSDGDNDIIYYWQDQNSIRWFKNNGIGSFTTSTISTGTHKNWVVYVHDIDADGHKDIISAANQGYKLAWFKNSGAQSFSPASEINSVAGRAWSIGVSDFNADGKPDVFTASTEDASVNWFRNTGHLSNTIKGRIRFDVDGNGCTNADVPVSQALVTTQSGGNTWSSFTLDDGSYTVYAGQGTFTSTVNSTFTGFSATPQSQQSVFASNTGATNTADFCLQANIQVTDIQVVIHRFTEIRPGFQARYKVIVKNIGTMQATGPVVINYNPAQMVLNYISETPVSQLPHSITIDPGMLLPFQTKEINLFFTVNQLPGVTFNEAVTLMANITVAADDTTANNSTQNTGLVVGSYDPNDIAVREGSQILLEDADEYLHYLIRFQNTGNYYAERVVVKNPLDSKLDWTTMQIESMSHTGRAEIINGAEATFTFDAIYLPASEVNEPASHGYIAYKIKPKANVQLGDTFTEQAHIYFDFNPAIDTNIVTTTVVDNAAGLPQFTAETVSVYPVPAKGILNVKANTDIAKIEIYNQAGQRVLSNASQNNIDISALSRGIYFAKIEDVNGSSVTKKIVKS